MAKETKRLKIGLYNPYFDSFGGGERYVLTLAEHWSYNHDVSVFWDTQSMLGEATNRFGLDLSKVKTVPNVFRTSRFVRKLIESVSYDLIFFLSDGSVPTTLAKHNILHFQVPFQSIAISPWKAIRYQAIVVNSEFTKKNLDTSTSIPVSVIYPPVDVAKFGRQKKTKTILSVGRFNGLYGAKKQDVLIRAFIEASKKDAWKGWRLILAGACLDTDKEYVEKLKKLAKGYPIEFQVNCPYNDLRLFYENAAIYWHAAGFGETEPEKMEHFGITTVEAMASSCVPVVYNGGGQSEIVKHKVNGYVWNTQKELLEETTEVMQNVKKREEMAKQAVLRAKDFSKEKFNQAFDALLTTICN